MPAQKESRQDARERGVCVGGGGGGVRRLWRLGGGGGGSSPWPQRRYPTAPRSSHPRLLTHGVDVDVLYTLSAPSSGNESSPARSSMRSGTNQGLGWGIRERWEGVGWGWGGGGGGRMNGVDKEANGY